MSVMSLKIYHSPKQLLYVEIPNQEDFRTPQSPKRQTNALTKGTRQPGTPLLRLLRTFPLPSPVSTLCHRSSRFVLRNVSLESMLQRTISHNKSRLIAPSSERLSNKNHRSLIDLTRRRSMKSIIILANRIFRK